MGSCFWSTFLLFRNCKMPSLNQNFPFPQGYVNILLPRPCLMATGSLCGKVRGHSRQEGTASCLEAVLQAGALPWGCCMSPGPWSSLDRCGKRAGCTHSGWVSKGGLQRLCQSLTWAVVTARGRGWRE